MTLDARPYVRPAVPSDCWAEFSPDRVHRYTLWREWDPALPYMQVVGLNPSTADEVQDDPTVRRCIRFARDAGFGALCMTNVFGYRATDPADLKRAVEPVGRDNDEWLRRIARHAGVVVAAWGVHGAHLNRDRKVVAMLDRISPLHCFRVTKYGHPAHPLYLPARLRPVPYRGTVGN